MNPRYRIPLAFLILFMGVFLFSFQTHAAKPVAHISSFKGDAVVLSDKEFMDVKLGLSLMHGDRIQTRNGEVEITFNDGALMKVRPYSSIMVQEGEERRGFLSALKPKKLVRRITLFVGRLWFKTGKPGTMSYLQTPTAVCGVRGTEVEIQVQWLAGEIINYLNTITGEVDFFGEFRDIIELTLEEAKKSAEYCSAFKLIDDAYNVKDDPAVAEEARLKAIAAGLIILKDNPYLPDDLKDAILKALGEEEIVEVLKEVELPDTETTEQEKKQEEASPSQ